ncbi:hypothetical protein ASG60_19615 [Methylobacterium sp. Leaf469]|nr:hypothetical protein ASG60_19615 [Methylobacterium sp. Leaf469]
MSFDKAPYFAALVASSCRASANARAALAARGTLGPLARMRDAASPRCTVKAPSTTSAMGASVQLDWVRMSWARPSEIRRAENASRAPSKSAALRKVWLAIAWTMARVFLTRCCNSPVSRRWCSSERFRSLMSSIAPIMRTARPCSSRMT